MSLRVMTWAWSIRLSPAPKLVLMALADEADDNGYCFPSRRRLADKCSLGQRTVRRILGQLEIDGYLKVQPRYRGDRSRTSNGYYLRSAAPPAKMARGRAVPDLGPRAPETGGPGSDAPPLPAIHALEDPPQPSARTSPERGNTANPPTGCGGDLQFPEQLSRGHVAALGDVLAPLDATRQQQVLDELAGRLKLGGIANPIRYCAALVQRVEQRQFRPELGIQVAESRAARLRYVERLNGSPTVDPTSTGARSECLPDDLRAPIERMRKRIIKAATDVQSGGRLTRTGCAGASEAPADSETQRLAPPEIEGDRD
jgi:hypothetical protein